MPLNPLELNYLQTLYQKADKDQKAEFVKRISGEPPEKRPPGVCTFEEHFASTVATRICPHCGRTRTVKDGTRAGKQRFLCRTCKKTFGYTSGRIPFASKKAFIIWQRFMRCLVAHKSLRVAAKECGISLPTAWHWKRKFLDRYRSVAKDTARELQISLLGQEQEDLSGAIEQVVQRDVNAMFKTRRKPRRIRPKPLYWPMLTPTPPSFQNGDPFHRPC